MDRDLRLPSNLFHIILKSILHNPSIIFIFKGVWLMVSYLVNNILPNPVYSRLRDRGGQILMLPLKFLLAQLILKDQWDDSPLIICRILPTGWLFPKEIKQWQ